MSTTAYLMVGQSGHKKAERRARWNAEVVYANLTEQQRMDRAMEILLEEIAADRNPLA